MHDGLDTSLQNGLAWYYLFVVVLNLGFAAYFFSAKKPVAGVVWAIVSAIFLIHMFAYFAHRGWVMPLRLRESIDWATGPVVYTMLSVVAFVLVLVFRRFFTRPQVAWAILDLTLLGAGWAMTDPSFRAIVTKPDNVPITMLIYSVGFFTWLGLYRAVQNDDRLARGEPVLEKLDDDKVLVWPDLVYTELIAMIIATFVLTVWAIVLKAPLEQPATSAKAPNPSKAPWYFLGRQEMLVYFDPWMAGVVLPTMIIVGLVAMPYIDFNREGNGYYSFVQRPFAITVFMFGFIVLWVTLIVLGTFLRGPNWNFFGPFEFWDLHKLEALVNVNLSEYIWMRAFRTGLPTNWFVREIFGILLVLGYVFVLPVVLAKTAFKTYFEKLGGPRFYVGAFLFLMMMSLPIKMLLRWVFNLKYIVGIPEFFFNI